MEPALSHHCHPVRQRAHRISGTRSSSSQTDAIARHARLRGRPVRFLTGTDEHAPKDAQAAAARRRRRRRRSSTATRTCSPTSPTRSLVSYDDFIRTSADPRHAPAVEDDLARVPRVR